MSPEGREQCAEWKEHALERERIWGSNPSSAISQPCNCEDKTMFSQRPRREFSRHRYPFPCPWCCSFNNCLLSTHHMLSHMLHAGGTEMSQKLCIPSGISQSSEGDRHKEQITKNMGHAIVQSYATGIELRGITYSG